MYGQEIGCGCSVNVSVSVCVQGVCVTLLCGGLGQFENKI